jgi:hypothetical protein
MKLKILANTKSLLIIGKLGMVFGGKPLYERGWIRQLQWSP